MKDETWNWVIGDWVLVQDSVKKNWLPRHSYVAQCSVASGYLPEFILLSIILLFFMHVFHVAIS